jgi:predicted GNAT family N-acyltransferase
MEAFEVKEVAYTESQGFIHQVRKQVFIVEQKVPAELEFDDADPLSVHLVAFINGQPVATGRISPEGKIGRMAVLKNFRKKGIGQDILKRLVDIGCRLGLKELYLSSQCHAIPFYEKAGFMAQGPVYEEAGIDHRMMVKLLTESWMKIDEKHI